MLKSDKLLHFEGLRGFASLIVIFHHLEYALALNLDYKVFTFFQDITGSLYFSGFIQSFFNFFINGNLAVYIFFFMSGYVISIKLFNSNNKYLIGAIFKRYFRLMPPILGAVLLGYLLMKFNLMYNAELSNFLGNINEFGDFYQFHPNFLTAIKSGVWNVLITSNLEGYNGPLWTMQAEYIGSLLCFLLFAIIHRFSVRYYIYAALIIGLFLINTPWLSSFIFGLMICDIDHTANKLKFYFNYLEEKILSKSTITIPLFILLLIWGRENFEWLTPELPFTKIIASSFLVIIVMKSKILKGFFSFRPLVFLGKISFSMYILHWPIICSLTCYIYLSIGSFRILSITASSTLTILLVIATSFIYTKFIDRNSIRFANNLGRFIGRIIYPTK